MPSEQETSRRDGRDLTDSLTPRRQDAQASRRPETHSTSHTASLGNDDELYPSRVNRARASLRVSAAKMHHYRLWCLNNGCTLQDAMELAMDNLTGRQGVKTPTVVSSVCVEDPSSEDSITHTTTEQTAGRQDVQLPPAQPPLPTGISLAGQPPQRSEFSLEVNLEYAWEAHNNNRGINKPDAWAMANLRSGKYDDMIRMWLAGKQREPLPPLRECRNQRCKQAFRPKPGASTVYCSPECNY